MSSRELSLSTAGLSWVDIVVAGEDGEDGADGADDESVFVIAQMVWVIRRLTWTMVGLLSVGCLKKRK
jgi:hypothetical protein